LGFCGSNATSDCINKLDYQLPIIPQVLILLDGKVNLATWITIGLFALDSLTPISVIELVLFLYLAIT
jgi:hypothetical protein